MPIEVLLTPTSADVLTRSAPPPVQTVWWGELRRTIKAHLAQRADGHYLVMDDALAHEIVDQSEAPGLEVAAPDLLPLLEELATAIRPQLTPPRCYPPFPAPTATSLLPNTVAIGQPSFELHVHGLGFRPGCVISFNGHDEPTTFVSDTDVSTGVDMSVWAAPSAPLPVSVRNPDNKSSEPLTFTFTDGGAAAMAAPAKSRSKAH